MDRRQVLSAALLPLVLRPASNVFESTAFANTNEREGNMSEPTQRIIETNGIRLNIAEQGKGPLVLMCHGFPESWYSWRHQLGALADAGFRAVAPDLRGYGQTDRPAPIEAYDIFQLTGDIIGLVSALGETQAFVVGHDWGSVITASAALLRPDLFRAVALLSVPYVPRRSVNQTQWEQMKYTGKIF